MKKRVFLTTAIALMFATVLGVAVLFGGFSAAVANADEADKLADFSDDFESYDVSGNYAETDSAFTANWTNNVFGGGEAQGMDSHLREHARVAYQNGESGNRVLAIDNTVGADSFFYAGPAGDYRVRNFTAEMKLRFLTAGVSERSWVGFSFRKKAQVHYTGTNNLMFVVQRYKNSDTLSGSAYATFNGGSPTDLNDVLSLYGDKLSLQRNNYKVPGLQANQDSDFMTVRLVAEDNTYKLYVNDSLVIDCTFTVDSFDYYGYLSINCCQANIQIDDVKVTVQDPSLPPEVPKLDAPEVVLNEEAKTISWERVTGATGYRIYTGNVVETVYRNSFDLTKLPAGTHSITVVAISDDPFEAKDSDPSQAVTFVKEEVKTEGEGGSNGGCSGSVATGGGVAGILVLVAGAAILSARRRKAV